MAAQRRLRPFFQSSPVWLSQEMEIKVSRPSSQTRSILSPDGGRGPLLPTNATSAPLSWGLTQALPSADSYWFGPPGGPILIGSSSAKSL